MPAQPSRLTADFAAVRPHDAAVLVMLARAFHREEGRTLGAAGEAALAAIARRADGSGMAVRDADRPVGYLIITLGYNVGYGGGMGSSTTFI